MTKIASFPILLIIISMLVVVQVVAAQAQIEAVELRARALEYFAPLPAQMPGTDNDTPDMVKLGRKLFFDKRLSADKTISCNSCHSVRNGGSYEIARSSQVRKSVKRSKRDSPTVLNAGFHIAQFWDGRSPTLETQAREPMLNPDEMAMPAEAVLLDRLRSISSYQRLFSTAFPKDADAITTTNAARAIAAFERTLVTEDRFDDFLKGKNRALSRAELHGLATFLDKGCQKCHMGFGLGGNGYEKLGLVHPYSNTNDLGRFNVTGNDADAYRFKVPSLRNVALTAPYFHDGEVRTLKDAIRTMAHLQLGEELAPAEVESIAAFLRTLSDKRRAGK